MARTRAERAAAAALLVCLTAAGLVAATPAAPAAEVGVSIQDNLFVPQEIHVDPGDTVEWTHVGTRVHDVTSDTGEFLSGDMTRGARFSHTFEKEGSYYYHCSFHGRSGKQGMWGVVVVGDPAPSEGEDEERPKLVVPDDFKTIQAAVDAAEPGSTIVVEPGVYKGDVSITTDDLIVRGVDRFRTVLDGDDRRSNGFVVEGVADVTIANLTVREFTGSGVRFVDATSYTVARVDAVENRVYGVSALRSYDGVVRGSFGWGSGGAAFHAADCMGCGLLLDGVHAGRSYLGFAGTNATGVTIRDSTWTLNGVGIVVDSRAAGEHAPGRGTLIVGNSVRSNGYQNAPGAGLPDSVGAPIGTGIWLAGVENVVVRDNEVVDHWRYGVLVTESDDGYAPFDDTVVRNRIRAARHGLAWDGAGSDDCFSDNDVTGETAPPEIQTLYSCDARPFVGTPYEPVREDVAAAVAASLGRTSENPPAPARPRCQKGRPGCGRK